MMRKILLYTAIMGVAGCKYAPENGTKSAVPFSGERAALPGAPYGLAPTNAELLDESGELALYSGDTAADVAYNETQRNAEPQAPAIRFF